jgi:hypothetical protein
VYVAFDVLYRFLTAACGYDVQYVRNFTDIDDKIIARAQQVGAPPAGSRAALPASRSPRPRPAGRHPRVLKPPGLPPTPRPREPLGRPIRG